MTTLYQEHVKTWSACQLCELSQVRTKVVLARGSVPCDVLFIGEAPGPSEDVIGVPFVGPAGKLFNGILARAMPGNVSYALTNLVCCIPRDEDGAKFSEPPPEAIEECMPRLREFVEICRPKLIVAVGALAAAWLMPKEGSKHSIKRLADKMLEVVHPAAIIRANVAQQGLMRQRCIVKIANAVRDL
jgi:uracil-DNA glycosylase